mmetsp:Transcript_10436/g.17652  ORF Transcript_10436/g.17652 Transcript_10436/m.17652 type:complete len:102 (+) Transcript_10436:557-862(+)
MAKAMMIQVGTAFQSFQMAQRGNTYPGFAGGVRAEFQVMAKESTTSLRHHATKPFSRRAGSGLCRTPPPVKTFCQLTMLATRYPQSQPPLTQATAFTTASL